MIRWIYKETPFRATLSCLPTLVDVVLRVHSLVYVVLNFSRLYWILFNYTNYKQDNYISTFKLNPLLINSSSEILILIK